MFAFTAYQRKTQIQHETAIIKKKYFFDNKQFRFAKTFCSKYFCCCWKLTKIMQNNNSLEIYVSCFQTQWFIWLDFMNKFSYSSNIRHQCKVSQYVQYTLGSVQNMCTKRRVKKKEGRKHTYYWITRRKADYVVRNDKDGKDKMTDININARHVFYVNRKCFCAIPQLYWQ